MNKKFSLRVAALVVVIAFASVSVEQALSDPQQAETPTKKDAPAKKDVKKPAKPDVEAGKATFTALCVACHGDLGKGDGVASAALDPKPRDLSNAKYMAELKDDYIVKLLKEGGAAVGKSPLMPALGAAMKDHELANVIAFVRSLSKPVEEKAAAKDKGDAAKEEKSAETKK